MGRVSESEYVRFECECVPCECECVGFECECVGLECECVAFECELASVTVSWVVVPLARTRSDIYQGGVCESRR